MRNKKWLPSPIHYAPGSTLMFAWDMGVKKRSRTLQYPYAQIVYMLFSMTFPPIPDGSGCFMCSLSRQL